MRLHLFNPEHDLALAADLSNFTSPHAGRRLRADLGFIPAIWASKDDYVLVENAEDAQVAFSRLLHRNFPNFVERHQLSRLGITQVEPWGWDLALRSFLLRHGLSSEACPTERTIGVIRDLSHRKTAVNTLCLLALEGTVGESVVADSFNAVALDVQRWGRVVVKAPWSSSGRGIRFIDSTVNDYQIRWIQNVITRQGSVVVEPYYNKIKDFAMEFESDGCGKVNCLGLSLFQTLNGAYRGNIIASEEEKRIMISRYVSLSLLDEIQERICQILGNTFQGRYKGPFGVDMMIVAHENRDGFLLHPCVEINLRRTMGHVALELSRQCRSGQVMMIEYTDNHYKFTLLRLDQY
jgi:hypothetical protein